MEVLTRENGEGEEIVSLYFMEKTFRFELLTGP